MNYDYIFENNKSDINKLLEYGFKKKQESFSFFKKISNNNFIVSIIINIDNKNFEVKVFDSENNEEYLPFNIKYSSGAFAEKIRNEVDDLIKDIVEKCFLSNSLKFEVLSYVKQKYDTKPEFPWEKYPSFATLKGKNNKWFGLIMNIPYKTLLKDKNGFVDVINLKINKKKIPKLIDNINIFPAYHMNKKYWISVSLNSKISIKQLKELIDESFLLACKK